MKKRIIFCTDLNTAFIYYTFLEIIYRLKDKKIIIALIIGERDSPRINNAISIIRKITPAKIHIYKYDDTNIPSARTKIEKKIALIEAKTNISIDEIKKLKYRKSDIGISIASNIISNQRCTQPHITPKQVASYYKYSAFTYECSKILKSIYPNSKAYIYNGRHYNTFPISDIWKENSLYYERIDNHQRIRIQKGRIHDFEYNSRLIMNHWKKSNINIDEKIKVSKDYYDNTSNNIFLSKLTTKNTKEIDNFINSGKTIISYFSSSEDEYESLHKSILINTTFTNQRSAIKYLIKWFGSNDEYKLIIRVHPHLETACTCDKEFWNGLSGKNVLTIPSSSKINSRIIIEASDKVISYFSTASIEATYKGKPSAVLSNVTYKDQNCVYELEKIDQISAFIKSKKIKPKILESTYPYAFFEKTYGHTPKIFEALDFSSIQDIEAALNENIKK